MEKLTVVKVGGQIVEEPLALQKLLVDFKEIPGHKVLVHGGGAVATDFAKELGVESTMVKGRRVTDAPMLKIVTFVYSGVNKQIVAGLQALNVNALGISGADLNCIVSDKRPVKEVDYGFVGDVKEVNTDLLTGLIYNGIVPVFAPLTHDGKGGILNTNADTIASEVAKAFSKSFEVTLVFCFEKKGVLSNESDNDSVIHVITKSEFKLLVADDIIQGGMIPKLENAFDAIEAGVKQVYIINAESLKDLDSGTKVINQ